MMLSPTAMKIFKMKYATHREETWENAVARITSYVAQDDLKKMRDYYELIYNKVFLPGGRIIANAGTNIKSLYNCFVIPIEDSREEIYGALQEAAEIFSVGGGIGYSFSNVREEGAEVKGTGGKASGPLSFMSLFDQTGEVISQASRRGAQMGILSVNHPDIIKFIGFKKNLNRRNARLLEEFKRNMAHQFFGGDVEFERDTEVIDDIVYPILEQTLSDDQLTHFNISVSLTDEFMQKVLDDDYFPVVSRLTKRTRKGYRATEVFDLIAQSAWECGDPGVFFYDRTNWDNLVQYKGMIEATNPCGEIGLLPNEACNLGSINLHAILDKENERIDLPFLEYVVRNGVRFLNDVHDVSETPNEKINEQNKGLRRIGLGVMGWADLLAEMEIPYDSDAAIELAEFLSWFISYFAWLESIELAEKDGPFPFYDSEKVHLNIVQRTLNSSLHDGKHDMEWVRENGTRNVSVTAIAPTGTLALLAGINSSIEPFFALEYKRNITEGVGNIAKDHLIERNPILENKLKKYKVDKLEDLPERVRNSFKTAHQIDWRWHVDHQAAWQKYVSNSVSKTINLPEEATVQDVKDAFMYMWESGLKGGTIYRNKSRSFQILDNG